MNSFAQLLHDELSQMDGHVDVNSDNYAISMMLLAAEVVGTNVYTISKVLGWSPSRLSIHAANAVERGLWVDGKQRGADKWSEEGGGVSFGLAVCVVDGTMRMEPDDRYSLTEKGLARAAELLKSAGGATK